MKQFLLTVLICTAGIPFAGISQTNLNLNEQGTVKKHQPKYGLKAGYNISKMAGSKANFDPANESGFMIAGFFSPSAKTGIGFRTEVVFSQTNHSLLDSSAKNSVKTNYIYLPQLTTFSIGKFLQLQAGGQVGILLQASETKVSGSSPENGIMDFMNKIDYGFAGGAEVYPFKGLIAGARYNISFGNMYKTSVAQNSPYPLPFSSDIKSKNAVVQFFIGYKF